MPKDTRSEIWLIFDSDQILTGTHASSSCLGPCVIHKPTDHWMRDLPLAFDAEHSTFYRTCEHGQVHQDPDERTRWTNLWLKNKDVDMQARLARWLCPECDCGCCSFVSKYLS